MKSQMNLPNVLSSFRLLTIPVIFLLIINSNGKNFPYLIALYFLSVWLDFFDGYFARKLKQETELGKILDPLADKLTVTATIIALIIKSDFPLWLGIAIIGRDLLILAAGLLIFKGKHMVTPSILVGKVTFALMGTMLMTFIVDLHPSLNLMILKQWFVALMVGFLVWSLAGYYEVYQQIIYIKRENA